MKTVRISILLLLLLLAAPVAYIILSPEPVFLYLFSKLGCRDVRIENASIHITETRADLLELECGEAPASFKAAFRGISVLYNSESLRSHEVSSISVESADFSTPWVLPANQPTSPTEIQLPSLPIVPFTQIAIRRLNFNAPSYSVSIQIKDGLTFIRDLGHMQYGAEIGGADGTVGVVAFKKFSGTGVYDIHGALPVTFQAFLGQLDYGVSLTKLSTKGELRPDRALNLKRAEATFLNANFSTKDIILKNHGMEGKIPLVFKGVDMGKVAALYGTENLKMTGMVDGIIPLSIDSKGVFVKAGSMDAKAPGGTIEYTGSTGLDISEPRGALVASVLKHINYSMLHANVSYSKSGDLVLAVTLRGRSPNVNTGQDVNVNLNIEENLPAFLRTLRLARGDEGFLDGQAGR